MASPQKEKGYTAIANETMEALSGIRIAGEARQILDTIIRKTYGFNKKEDAISLSQFALLTKLKKPTIIRGIAKLKSMNLIIINDNGSINKYRFNKDFDTWKPLSKKITLSKKIMTVDNKDNDSLSKKIPTKVDITKDTVTKVDRRKRFTPPSFDEIVNYLVEKKKDNKSEAEFKAESIIEFYESKGWMIGKNKMVSWPHAISRAWREWDWDSRRKKHKTSTGFDVVSTEKIMTEGESLDDKIKHQKLLLSDMDKSDPDWELENNNLKLMEESARNLRR
jgi:phage replication O-like protein O